MMFFVKNYMQRLPSNSMHRPVIISASSVQRKSAALAISLGRLRRPRGIVEINFARFSGVFSPMNRFSMPDSPAKGLMALTWILSGASSMAIALVAVIIAPLEVLYHTKPGLGRRPASEATLKITPRALAPSSTAPRVWH